MLSIRKRNGFCAKSRPDRIHSGIHNDKACNYTNLFNAFPTLLHTYAVKIESEGEADIKYAKSVTCFTTTIERKT